MPHHELRHLLQQAISPPYDTTFLARDFFRLCLEVMHAHMVANYQIASPSLELGIGDGLASRFVHGERDAAFSVGLDMPFGTTAESRSLLWHPAATHYRQYVNSSMEHLPFTSDVFGTVYTSETLFYGMDLQRTAREIHRVLRPGGMFMCFNATDLWYRFPSYLGSLQTVIPSFSLPGDPAFLEIFTEAGFECVRHQYFFSPAMEILLLKLSSAGFGQDRSLGLLNYPEAARESLMQTLAELIEYESRLDRDGFHHFMVFRKKAEPEAAGVAPAPQDHAAFDVLDHLRCIECGCEDLALDPTRIVCRRCEAEYAVVCGVPQFVHRDQRDFSPITTPQLQAIQGGLIATVEAGLDAFMAQNKDFMADPRPSSLHLALVLDPTLADFNTIRVFFSALLYRLKAQHSDVPVSFGFYPGPGDATQASDATGAIGQHCSHVWFVCSERAMAHTHGLATGSQANVRISGLQV